MLDHEKFLALSPSADDVWLYFMGSRNGATFRKVGRRHHIVTWPGSQKISLRAQNVPTGGGNDQHIARMAQVYGFPVRVVEAVTAA